MNVFRNTPIKRKLTIINMSTSCLALLVVGIAFLAYESIDYYGSLLEELAIKAEMIGYNSSAALSFDDADSAKETLESLHGDPDILCAALYDAQGKVFAAYQSAKQDGTFVPPPIEHETRRFHQAGIELFQDIQVGGEKVGTVYIRHGLDEFWSRSRRYILIVLMMMAVASAASFLLLRRLREVISRPVSHLAGVVGAVTSAKDYSLRAVREGEDELGRLIDGFNEMLSQIQQRDSALEEARGQLEERVAERTRELEDIHRQLVGASRQAGMAEVATNVLHNIGNVLNSVNVSCSVITDKVRKSRIGSVAKTANLLRDHAGDLAAFLAHDPAGQQLPNFLGALASRLVEEQDAVIEELRSLNQNIEHIKDIVVAQQGHAKSVNGVRETVSIDGLVKDAVRMDADALGRHRVEVVLEFGEAPPVLLEKHKALQILVNLIGNARQALRDCARPDKRLILRITRDNGHVAVSVSDNGIGIAAENMTRIFAHGFTTKKDGHGFGLHSSALSAREMGGSLSVSSDGPGTGATFTLTLPVGLNGRSQDPMGTN